jgi:N-acetylneuraminate synthase/sialic acid synthase
LRKLSIDGKKYDDSSLPFVIAELGHNHQGNLETCLQMIRAAAYSGASAVKLQKRSNIDLFTKAAFDAPYNSENAYGPTYGLHREALEFGEEEYKECILEAKRNNITFFSTAFDFQSVDFLMNLGVPAIKIASGDLKSTPLLKYASTLGVPLIVSTGGADLSDVDRAVELLSSAGSDFAILQCTAGYPPKYEELNLRVISTFRERYPNTVVGYSGHDSGIAMSLVAYVLGARVIEKHFTLNRAMKGTDHAFSLEPGGMRKLVRDLERAQISLGDGEKRVYDSELAPIRKMGKMIVAGTNIAAGTVANLSMFEFRSPSEGLYPYQVEQLVGLRFARDVASGESIGMEDFEK